MAACPQVWHSAVTNQSTVALWWHYEAAQPRVWPHTSQSSMSGLYTRWTEGRPDVAKYAYVVRSKTDVRRGPGPDAEPTGRVLEADQRIEVSERRTLELSLIHI